MKVNYCFLIGYTFCLGVGVLQIAITFTGITVVVPILQAKFSWTEEETISYNTILGEAATIGMAIGSLVGGKSITIGRRRAMMFV